MKKCKKPIILFLIGILSFSCNSKPGIKNTAPETANEPVAQAEDSTLHKNRNEQPVNNASENPANQPDIHSEHSNVDQKLIEKYPLLPHLAEQKNILKENSRKSNSNFEPDGKHLFGKFDSGVLEMTINEIGSEPVYIYGKTDEMKSDAQLEFLVYKIPMEKLDKITPGRKYKVHWIETICFMEPFDHGYQRCYVVYKIE